MSGWEHITSIQSIPSKYFELLINISLVIQKQEHAVIKLEAALEDNSMESLM